MRITTSVLAAAFIIAYAAPALADPAPAQGGATATITTTGTTTPPPKAPKTPDPNEMVCKSEEDTGSRIPSRICHTRAQWEDMSNRARQSTDDMQGRGDNMTPMRGG